MCRWGIVSLLAWPLPWTEKVTKKISVCLFLSFFLSFFIYFFVSLTAGSADKQQNGGQSFPLQISA